MSQIPRRRYKFTVIGVYDKTGAVRASEIEAAFDVHDAMRQYARMWGACDTLQVIGAVPGIHHVTAPAKTGKLHNLGKSVYASDLALGESDAA
jgi:hypothetical protein